VTKQLIHRTALLTHGTFAGFSLRGLTEGGNRRTDFALGGVSEILIEKLDIVA
jgi:hypothetical protein